MIDFKFRKVFKYLPVLIVYSTKGLRGHSAYCYGLLSIIHPKFKDDEGLHQHELTHTRQWFKSGMLPYTVLYRWNKWYRLGKEVEAYRYQMKWSPQHKVAFAHFIANKYNLNIAVDTALKLLIHQEEL